MSRQTQAVHQSVRQSATPLTREQEVSRKKYNLNKWKYAELRDTVNTSCGE